MYANWLVYVLNTRLQPAENSNINILLAILINCALAIDE